MKSGISFFDETLRRHRMAPLERGPVRSLQVNVGKLCNQACHHCHVDAGPRREEIMSAATADRIVELMVTAPAVELLDLTGGAPELNPSFRSLVAAVGALGRRVMVRCNLTVLFEPGMEWLPAFYREHRIELVCSLPCYTADNVDRQRGRGVFDKSIEALRELNRLGYGRPESGLALDLVYNPVGAFLPPAQEELEMRYRNELSELFGIEFNRLLTITNMPIRRFAEMLRRSGELERYTALLVSHFNAATVPALMCRELVSVSWDGKLYDCDFNQMLGLPVHPDAPSQLGDFDQAALASREIVTGEHCLGCTAGSGSSCGGATA